MSRRSRGALVALVGSSAALLVGVAADGRGGPDSGAPPSDPVVVPGPGGAYAVAVPALAGPPAISGDSLSFAVEDQARERLFSIGQASADGWRSLYTAPAKRPGSVSLLSASHRRVVVLRYPPHHVQTCEVGGECSPSRAELIGGSPSGPLGRLFGATERLEARGSCRRRIAQLGDSGGAEEVSLSGDRIAYSRRVRCLSPRRRGHWQIVVRNLQTGAVRVVGRRGVIDVQLAGDFLAFRPDVRGVDEVGPSVINLRKGRVAYRARPAEWYSLGADGKLAVGLFRECCSLIGRLGWYSPQQPRLHRLPNRVSIFTASPLSYAKGRIAYIRSHGADGYALAVTDLRGNAQVHAAFPGPSELESFAFDGTRLAFAHTRYRPDQGSADDGLRAICVDDQILVQASATVIETYRVKLPARLPAEQLPAAEPYRSPAETRPECPYRD